MDNKISTGQFVRRVGDVDTLTKKHLQDAGLDIASIETVVIPAHGVARITTGLKVAIPENHVGLIWSRSGLAFKHDIEVGAGCIDASYRGEIKVKLYNFGEADYEVRAGDNVAQLLTLPVNLSPYQEVDALDSTDRGEHGFGHTGR